MPQRPATDTWDSADCGRSYRRCACGHSLRSARHDRLGLRCGRLRLRSLRAAGRGSDEPCWRRAKRRRGGGKHPPLRALALVTDTAAWKSRCNAECAHINWMFTTEKARAKMQRAYPKPAANRADGKDSKPL